MKDRRSVYFSFQGLLMSVLLLIFLYQYKGTEGWVERFDFLVLMLLTSMLGLRLIPAAVLGNPWFQAGLFIGDAALASLCSLASRAGAFLVVTVIRNLLWK